MFFGWTSILGPLAVLKEAACFKGGQWAGW